MKLNYILFVNIRKIEGDIYGENKCFLDKTFSSYITMSIIGLIAFILALLMPFFIPSVELIKTLQGLVQLNITVAIGMGALSIALKLKKFYS